MTNQVQARLTDENPPEMTDDAMRDEQPDDTGRLVRPYAMTGGRTTADADISLEAQVQTTTRLGSSAIPYRFEAAAILEIAERPIALVELAARADLPIGVARVLVADLVDDGVMMAQKFSTSPTNYTSLLEKVLDGVKQL